MEAGSSFFEAQNIVKGGHCVNLEPSSHVKSKPFPSLSTNTAFPDIRSFILSIREDT
jgi:hypothetical protein